MLSMSIFFVLSGRFYCWIHAVCPLLGLVPFAPDVHIVGTSHLFVAIFVGGQGEANHNHCLGDPQRAG